MNRRLGLRGLGMVDSNLYYGDQSTISALTDSDPAVRRAAAVMLAKSDQLMSYYEKTCKPIEELDAIARANTIFSFLEKRPE